MSIFFFLQSDRIYLHGINHHVPTNLIRQSFSTQLGIRPNLFFELSTKIASCDEIA